MNRRSFLGWTATGTAGLLLPTKKTFVFGSGMRPANGQFKMGVLCEMPDLYAVPTDWKAGRFRVDQGAMGDTWCVIATDEATGQIVHHQRTFWDFKLRQWNTEVLVGKDWAPRTGDVLLMDSLRVVIR